MPSVRGIPAGLGLSFSWRCPSVLPQSWRYFIWTCEFLVVGQPFASMVLGQHPGPFLQDECDNQMFPRIPREDKCVCIWVWGVYTLLCCGVCSISVFRILVSVAAFPFQCWRDSRYLGTRRSVSRLWLRALASSPRIGSLAYLTANLGSCAL